MMGARAAQENKEQHPEIKEKVEHPTPTCITVNKDNIQDQGVIYIGRCSTELGIPGSKWGNPLQTQVRTGTTSSSSIRHG